MQKTHRMLVVTLLVLGIAAFYWNRAGRPTSFRQLQHYREAQQIVQELATLIDNNPKLSPEDKSLLHRKLHSLHTISRLGTGSLPATNRVNHP